MIRIAVSEFSCLRASETEVGSLETVKILGLESQIWPRSAWYQYCGEIVEFVERGRGIEGGYAYKRLEGGSVEVVNYLEGMAG